MPVTLQLAHRRARQIAAAPCPVPASNTLSPGLTSIAAASIIGSIAARYPLIGWRRVTLPSRKKSSLKLAGTVISGASDKAASLTHVPEHRTSTSVIFFKNHYTSRYSDRAPLKHTHVAVKNKSFDSLRFEDRFSPGQKNNFIRSEKFFQTSSTLTVNKLRLCSVYIAIVKNRGCREHSYRSRS